LIPIDPNETLRQIRQLAAHGQELGDLVFGPDQSETMTTGTLSKGLWSGGVIPLRKRPQFFFGCSSLESESSSGCFGVGFGGFPVWMPPEPA
jgi:hypothetical protein